MKVDQVLTIYRKELLETMRDRRTLIIMVVVPIVLYPLMALFGVQAIQFLRAKIQKEQLSIGVAHLSTPFAQRVVVAAEADESTKVLFQEIETESAADRVASGELAAALVLPEDIEQLLEDEQPLELLLYYDSGDAKSQEGRNRLKELLDALHNEIVGERLTQRDLDKNVIEPFQIKRENVASAERKGAFLLGGLLSFLLITMAMTGAFYPAVDLTAGEKERGTLETLLVAPVGRGEIIMGKYLTVLTISVSTSLLNLGCMGLTFTQIFSTIGNNVDMSFSVNATTLLAILLTLIPVAALLSAVTLGSSTFARSFKEAQSYLTPIFILVMFPSMLPVLPGVELTPVFASLPIAGPSLLIRALLMGDATWVDVATVLASTAVYAGLMLSWATELYQKESTLFREENASPMRLQRPRVASRYPSAVAAVSLFVVILALQGYLNMNANPDSSILLTLLTPQVLLYLAIPIAVAYWFRNDLARTFSLRLPSLRGVLATPILFVGGMSVVLTLSQWQQSYAPVGTEQQEVLRQVIEGIISDWGPFGSVALIALTPAICEEVFCRGFLLSGLLQRGRSRRQLWMAAVGCGLLFGIMHLDPSRLLSTTLLGTILAWVVIRTGSIWPAMLIHLFNNATVTMFTDTYRDLFPNAITTRATEPIYSVLLKLGENPEFAESSWVPFAVLLGGAALLGIGFGVAGNRASIDAEDCDTGEVVKR